MVGTYSILRDRCHIVIAIDHRKSLTQKIICKEITGVLKHPNTTHFQAMHKTDKMGF